MPTENEDDLADAICSQKLGSIVAAAGCGKTEQIAKAVGKSVGRRLVLTHTHAGVEALRKRLRDLRTPSSNYAIDTIAGWALRYAASFPTRSGLQIGQPKKDSDWITVYECAVRLLASSAVSRILRASYQGVLVDEYQDCGTRQHAVITELARILPVCVFGDPLQAIFDFNAQSPVDWASHVFPTFPRFRTLTTPHRWINAGNPDLAAWLASIRRDLEAGRSLSFNDAPACVHWEWLPSWDGPRQNAITKACLSTLQFDGTVVVIADPKNLNGRAAIAKNLAKHGFTNIEPIECKPLTTAAAKLDRPAADMFGLVLTFLETCMSGIARAEFDKAIASKLAGGNRGKAKFGEAIELAVSLQQSPTLRGCLEIIDCFRCRPTTKVFRRELLYAMRTALEMAISGETVTLSDAVWHVQNKIRHAGRISASRSVGSVLLVKGLQFEHSVVVHADGMGAKDWYVALTRATQSITVLSPSKTFRPDAGALPVADHLSA